MNIVTTFEDRRRRKQFNHEKKLLHDLSIQSLKKSVLIHFNEPRIGLARMSENLEEACIDVAIEAYLNGGLYSRFAVFGEPAEKVKARCGDERLHFTETLYHFWLYWDFEQSSLKEEKTLEACSHFVDYWWNEGFKTGERHRKLRLH